MGRISGGLWIVGALVGIVGTFLPGASHVDLVWVLLLSALVLAYGIGSVTGIIPWERASIRPWPSAWSSPSPSSASRSTSPAARSATSSRCWSARSSTPPSSSRLDGPGRSRSSSSSSPAPPSSTKTAPSTPPSPAVPRTGLRLHRRDRRHGQPQKRLVDAEARQREIANLDPLTGIANRRAFDAALRHELAARTESADGRRDGDRCPSRCSSSTSTTSSRSTTTTDTRSATRCCGRPRNGPHRAARHRPARAHRRRRVRGDRARRPRRGRRPDGGGDPDRDLDHEPGSAHPSPHASLGLAVFPGDGEYFEALLRAADQRLLRVKSDGHLSPPGAAGTLRSIRARRLLQTRLILTMWRDLLEPFQLPFVQRGLLEVLILAVPAGLLGTWIVLRGLAFFSHAVGTAAFPGLVLADGLGFAAPLGAFAAAAAFSRRQLRPRRGAGGGRDSVVAIVLVACLAAGVILASDVFGSGANVETLLFGSLLLVDGDDIALPPPPPQRPCSPACWSAIAGCARLRRRGAGPAGRRSAAPGRAPLGLIALATTAALRGRRPPGRLPLRRPRDHRPAADPADAELAAGERRPGRPRGHRRPLALGQDRRPAGGDDRLRLRSRLRARRRARWPRRRGAAGSRPPPALAALVLLAGCGQAGPSAAASSTSSRRPPSSATGSAGRGHAVVVDQVLRPNTDPHGMSRGRATSRPRRGPGWFSPTATASTPGSTRSSRQRQRRRGLDPRRAVPDRLPGESSGAEASRYDPHWWHDPRNAEAAVREIERRLAAADPAHRRRVRSATPRAYLAPPAPRSTAGIAGLLRARSRPRGRKLVTDHDAFGYFAHRYGIDVVGAVDPLADDPGAALGQGPQRAGEDDRGAST